MSDGRIADTCPLLHSRVGQLKRNSEAGVEENNLPNLMRSESEAHRPPLDGARERRIRNFLAQSRQYKSAEYATTNRRKIKTPQLSFDTPSGLSPIFSDLEFFEEDVFESENGDYPASDSLLETEVRKLEDWIERGRNSGSDFRADSTPFPTSQVFDFISPRSRADRSNVTSSGREGGWWMTSSSGGRDGRRWWMKQCNSLDSSCACDTKRHNFAVAASTNQNEPLKSRRRSQRNRKLSVRALSLNDGFQIYFDRIKDEPDAGDDDETRETPTRQLQIFLRVRSSPTSAPDPGENGNIHPRDGDERRDVTSARNRDDVVVRRADSDDVIIDRETTRRADDDDEDAGKRAPDMTSR